MNYTAMVYSLSNMTESFNASVVTFVTTPQAPTKLRTPQIGENFIDLYWRKPEGVVDFYQVCKRNNKVFLNLNSF